MPVLAFRGKEWGINIMENLIFILCFVVFFILIIIKEALQARKREKAFIKSLYENYGSIPKKEYSLERYQRIASYYNRHKREGQLDDITWNDLNMDEIFKRMNYTFSASGEEYLYYTLRNTVNSKEELEHLEEIVNYFREHADERVKVQFLMSQLGYTGKFSLYDYIDQLDYLGKRTNSKHYLFNFLFIPFLLLMPYQLSISLAGLAVLIVYNILSYFKEKRDIEPYVISFSYIMRLLQVCDKLCMTEIEACEKEWEEIRKHKSVLKVMRKGSFWVLSGNNSITTGNPLDIVIDYVKMIFHVDLIHFNKMLQGVRAHVEDIDRLISTVGYLEAAIAVGAFRESLEEFCVPELIENDSFCMIDGYHPLLLNPVKNSIQTQKGVLLTGSNASGKSTFLKTVAINAILAQTIHTCAASGYTAQLYDIYSSMSLRDSIESGESYYIVEVKALKRIVDAASQTKRPILCFVDEVLRGTNTIERIAASTQILQSLTGNKYLCFAATHDIELTELLKASFDNYHFEEDIRDGDIFFNYQLMKGKATTRNAIKLLEIMGYQKCIIDKASRQAEHFVCTGSWE